MSDEELVEWEEPPVSSSRGRPAGVWLPILEQLEARPGVWARIRTYPTTPRAANTARDLRKRLVKIPAGNWEFTSRKRSDGTGAVYARYLGPEDAE